jgi:hypothetical protein
MKFSPEEEILSPETLSLQFWPFCKIYPSDISSRNLQEIFKNSSIILSKYRKKFVEKSSLRFANDSKRRF